jgi:hypothetical protein
MTTPRKPFSDAFSQAFLGEDPQVQQGQTVDSEAQANAFDGYLQDEAVVFGDNLMQWIAAHKNLPLHVRAWGFVLGVFCVRAEFPAGATEFDQIVARAGEDLDLPRKEPDNSELPEWTTKDLREAANFAELVSGYIALLRRQNDVRDEQAVYGIGRAWHNLRETFPMAGTRGFDILAKEAVEYYTRNR